jgi:hypothetical protein
VILVDASPAGSGGNVGNAKPAQYVYHLVQAITTYLFIPAQGEIKLNGCIHKPNEFWGQHGELQFRSDKVMPTSSMPCPSFQAGAF